MENKRMKIGLLLIAAVLLVGVVFAGAASAEPVIEITNTTGTYAINSSNPVVYGDDPATDGNVTYIEEDGIPVLTLHGFNASTTTEHSVIFGNEDVSDLKIVLQGTSTLNASEKAKEATIYLDNDYGNLTITTIPGTPGKLIVNQSLAESSAQTICVYGLLRIEGEDTTVEAYAKGADNGAYAFMNNGGIEIDGATVTAIADAASGYSTEGMETGDLNITNSAHVKVIANSSANVKGLYAWGDVGITIDDGSEVEVHATSTNGEAFALYADNDIVIDSAKVNASADTDSAYIETIYAVGGYVTIKDSQVEAKATSNSGEVYALDGSSGISIEGTSVVNLSAKTGNGFMDTIYTGGDLVVKDGVTLIVIAEAEYTDDNYIAAIEANGAIDISHAAKVTAIANNTENAYAIYSDSGDISIADSTIDELNATSASGRVVYTIYLEGGNLSITDSAIEKMSATSASNGEVYVLSAQSPYNVSIINSKIGEMKGSSNDDNAYVICANNISIIDTRIEKMTSITKASDTQYNSYVIRSETGKISLINSTVGEMTASSNDGDAYAIREDDGDILLFNSTIDEVNTTSASDGYVSTFITNTGNISIVDSEIVEMKAFSNSYIDVICANSVDISSTQIGNITAYSEDSDDINVFYINQNIAITDSTIDKMTSTGNGNANVINIHEAGDITIDNASINSMTATGDSGSAIVIQIKSGNISISNATIDEMMAVTTSESGRSYVILTDTGDVSISNSTVNEINATASTENSMSAICASDGNISIIDSDILEMIVHSDAPDYAGIDALYANDNLIIENVSIAVDASGTESGDIYAFSAGTLKFANINKLVANGTSAAFAFTDQRNFSALADNYEYWVNSTGPALPLIKLNHSQFNDDGNWTGGWQKTSVYTNVLIAKILPVTLDANGGEGGSASVNVTYGSSKLDITNPKRSGYTFAGWYTKRVGGDKVAGANGKLVKGVYGYTDEDGTWIYPSAVTLHAHWSSSSSGSNGGATIILTETPTVTPTATPTLTPSVPTITPSAKPTAQQTQKSPAPFAGLVLGLGAALMLARMRK